MKILFVLEYFYPHIGGAERVFYNQTIELAKKDKVTVVTVKTEDTKEREKINGVDIIRVKTPDWAQRYWFMLLSLPHLFRLVPKYDVIHTTTYNAALPAWIVSKIYNKKILITILEVIGRKWFSLEEKNKLLLYGYYFYEKLILQLPFDRYIAISNSTKKDLLNNFKISKNKVVVSYPILDTKFWDPLLYNKNNIRKSFGIKNKQFIYLYFGRSGISKGPEYLIKAVPEIKRRIKNSRLMMILSPHPLRRYRYLKQLIKKVGVKDILLIPPVDDKELAKYIISSNCVVVPSLTEGYGYSALEATLMKVPLVASDVGSLPEVLPEGTLFVRPKSSQQIAEAVYKIYKEKKKVVGFPKPLLSKNYGTNVKPLYHNL